MLIIDVSPQLWVPTPTDIGSGLYLNARQNITVTSGAVSQWKDRDDKWTFAQSNPSLRFLYNATGWNGTPAIQVTSTSQRLIGTTNFTPLIGTSGFTTFALVRHTVTGWIWEHGNITPSARTGFVVIDNTLLGVVNGQTTTGAIPASTNNLFVWRFDGSASTKSTLRLNGANLTSGGITATATTTNAGALNIGFGVDLNTFLGFMSDLLILPYAASDALIQKFEGCLAWQSGQRLQSFNALHPFFSRPPLTSDP